jgi:hypothetical protein
MFLTQQTLRFEVKEGSYLSFSLFLLCLYPGLKKAQFIFDYNGLKFLLANKVRTKQPAE